MILHILLTCVLSIALVEFVRMMPLAGVLRQLQAVANRSLHVLRVNGVSEHWKERALMAYARRMFIASAGLGAIILAVLALVLGTVALGDRMTGAYGSFLFGPVGLLSSVGLAAAWWWIRSRAGR